MFTIRLKHNDKTTKCRFFVVLEDCPALQGMSDIEVLDILKITCEVMGDPYKSRMFECKTMQTSNGPSCKANKVQQTKADSVDVKDTNSNIPDYFKSSIKTAAEKV